MKKIFIGIIGVIVVALAVLAAGITLVYVSEGFVTQSFPVPGNNVTIKEITDEDLARHPALKHSLETLDPIFITTNPFAFIRYKDQCVNKSESIMIWDEFGVLYPEDGASKLSYRRLLWNDTYYELHQFAA
ncbi:hypothetical protein [Methanorbis rubei]|uniref:Uncharacterized protein n=1 Tax=Methanorbis rubei TaxID=3028300 RepID=A0AAE4MEI3_9EURY|nr:hypothetical protein [Methanocorpusculaceae archaeon Cs1]